MWPILRLLVTKFLHIVLGIDTASVQVDLQVTDGLQVGLVVELFGLHLGVLFVEFRVDRQPSFSRQFAPYIGLATKDEGPWLPRGLPRYSRQRPTLPRSCPRSTIGAGGLNFRVRNGNGWVPPATVTGNSRTVSRTELDTDDRSAGLKPCEHRWSSRTTD